MKRQRHIRPDDFCECEHYADEHATTDDSNPYTGHCGAEASSGALCSCPGFKSGTR